MTGASWPWGRSFRSSPIRGLKWVLVVRKRVFTRWVNFGRRQPAPGPVAARQLTLRKPTIIALLRPPRASDMLAVRIRAIDGRGLSPPRSAALLAAPTNGRPAVREHRHRRTRALDPNIYSCKRMRHSSSAPPIANCRTGSDLPARVRPRVAHIHNLHGWKPAERKVEIPI